METGLQPLAERYASPAMVELWGDRRRLLCWRDLWIALAEAQHELGLSVSAEQVAELRATRDDLDLARAAELESELRHDVMAHIHAWGEKAPRARGIIHLGATSCYVSDNADLIAMHRGLGIIEHRLVTALRALSGFARAQAEVVTVGATHFQPAQFTTVGKRACLWAQDLLWDLEAVRQRLGAFIFRGIQGTTGTQDSFLKLCGGDAERVEALQRAVARRAAPPGARVLGISGQTYSRKFDQLIVQLLAGIAASASKFAHDVRLLAGLGELGEPFGQRQVGSSAMPYKRNPMRSERICALARFVISLESSAGVTAATQWLERSLDDSANRRLVLPQAYLAVDAILLLVADVAGGLETRPLRIAARVAQELPFIATEELLMAAVERGGDRQALHEKIRGLALEAHARRERGEAPGLLEALAHVEDFRAAVAALGPAPDPRRYTGLAARQVARFLSEELEPALLGHVPPPDLAGESAGVRV